jgi:hypothetical protein
MQQIALVDTETGEYLEQELHHSAGEAVRRTPSLRAIATLARWGLDHAADENHQRNTHRNQVLCRGPSGPNRTADQGKE